MEEGRHQEGQDRSHLCPRRDQHRGRGTEPLQPRRHDLRKDGEGHPEGPRRQNREGRRPPRRLPRGVSARQ